MPFNLFNSRNGFHVGIELEFEDRQASHDVYSGNASYHPLWSMTEDGSLRAGAELVSSPLMYPDGVNEALGELKGILSKYPHATTGDRSSMHIHVNVSDLTNEQFKSFMYLSLSLEPVLMKYCSALRQESNFCVPTYNSINQVPMLNLMFKTDGQGIELRDLPKYAAIGLHRLRDLGTVEFRMFEGTLDPAKIAATVELLYSIYTTSIRTTVSELSDRKKQVGVVSLLTPLLREVAGRFINQQDLETTIERGVRMANDMVRPNLDMEALLELHAKMFPVPEEPSEKEVIEIPEVSSLSPDMNTIFYYAFICTPTKDSHWNHLVDYGRVLADSVHVTNFNQYVKEFLNNGHPDNQETYEMVFDGLYKLGKAFADHCNPLLENATSTSNDGVYQYNLGA